MSTELTGKYFSIIDPIGIKTVIYRINETAKDLQKEYPKHTVERLVSSEELVKNGTKKTFFIDFPEKSGEDLVILSFTNNRVVVNRGLLKDNEVRVSHNPIPVQYDSIYSDKEMVVKNFKYTPDLKRPIMIIDPVTTKEVEPVIYYDDDTNEYKGKCKIKPNKDYFTFEIK